MTTRTTLSAACPPRRATQGQPGEVFPAPWSSLASLVDASFSRDTGRWSRTATFPWPPRPIRRGGRLIANLELESRLTYRKLSPLIISNRKFFAISYLASHSALACPAEDHRRRVTEFLIANARLEIPASPTKQSTATKSNRERIAIFHLTFRARPLLTQHSPLRVTGRGTRVAVHVHELRVTNHSLCSLRHTTQIRFSRIPALRYAAVTGPRRDAQKRGY
jgi:hypothetical protein